MLVIELGDITIKGIFRDEAVEIKLNNVEELANTVSNEIMVSLADLLDSFDITSMVFLISRKRLDTAKHLITRLNMVFECELKREMKGMDNYEWICLVCKI